MTLFRSGVQRAIDMLSVAPDDAPPVDARRVIAWVDPRLWVVAAGGAAVVAGLAVADQGMLVVVAFLAAVIAGLSFFRPEIGLFCFAFMLYSRASENLTDTFAIPSIAPLFAVFLLTVLVMRDGIGALWRSRMAYWTALVAYALVLLASVFVAVNPEIAFTAVIDYTRELIFILVIVLYTRSIGGTRVLIWGLLLGGLFPALLTIYQAISGSTFQFYGFGQNQAQIVVPGEIVTVSRPAGQVGDANFYALALITLIPLAMHRFRYEPSRWMRQFALLATIALGIATMLTYSRGGYLALAAVLVALAVAGFLRVRVLVVTVLIAVAILPVLPSSYTDRVTSLFDIVSSAFTDEATEQSPTADDTSVSGRQGEILAGVNMFRDHPVLGVGVRNYPEYYQEYGREIGIDRRVQRAAHSLYVEIAAETGVLGIAAFGGLILSLFLWLRRVWSSPAHPDELRDLARVLGVALFGYLFASIFLHAGYPRFLWMIAAASLATADIAFERQTRRSVARLLPIRPVAVPASFAQPGSARVWVSSAALLAVLVVSVISADLVLGRSGIALLPTGDEDVKPVLIAAATVTPTAALLPTREVTIEATATIVPADDRLALTIAMVPQPQQESCVWYVETQHNLCGSFLEFWESNGGLSVFGFPLSERFDMRGQSVQYFERARFEASDGDSGAVTVADLGVASMLARIGVERSPPSPPLEDEEDCIFEDETGHNICGRFAYYWVTFGGVELFGYPLSEVLEEEGTRMQYFQRARFEFRPGFAPDRFDIVLARVGAEEIERMLAPR